MKVLFLDIDGVVNCATTTQRHRGFIGIDPFMAFLVGKITLAVPDLKVVLSSSWRNSDDGIEEVKKQVCALHDYTPSSWYSKEEDHHSERGEEIKAWLDKHPEVTRYAILDDDAGSSDLHEGSFFQTYWSTGITEEIAAAVTAHLNS